MKDGRGSRSVSRAFPIIVQAIILLYGIVASVLHRSQAFKTHADYAPTIKCPLPPPQGSLLVDVERSDGENHD